MHSLGYHHRCFRCCIWGDLSYPRKHTEELRQLLPACKSGSVEIVLSQLDEGVSIDLEDGYEGTPLYTASKYGQLDVVKLLLARGAGVDAPICGGYTSLIIAASHGHVDVMRVLVDSGASVDLVDGEGNSPLYYGSQKGHTAVVEFLLERGASLCLKNHKGITPLDVACERGHSEAFKMLVERGASLGLADTVGLSDLLHLAVRYGTVEMVVLLLDNGAPVDSVDAHGNSPLVDASPNLGVIKLLIDRGAKVGLDARLFKAAFYDNVEVAELLLDSGADVNWTNSAGESALVVASRYGYFKLAELLISKGANQGIEAALKESALQLNHRATKLIIRKFPMILVDPTTLCHVAASEDAQSSEILQLIIGNCKFLDAVVESGYYPRIKQTALHATVLKRQISLVRQLVLHGADPSIPYARNEKVLKVEELCAGDAKVREALRPLSWNPKSHVLHPKWTRDAITWQQHWPFDHHIMHKIFSYVAFRWYYNTGKV